MSQPQPLETIYTRALRLLGLRPASRPLSTFLTVQSVQIVADVSDVSIPHSNPVFAFTIAQVAPGLADSAMVAIQAGARMIRLRQFFFHTVTAPRMWMSRPLG